LRESRFRNIKSLVFVTKIMKEIDEENVEKVIYWTCRAIQNKPDDEILRGILAATYYKKNQWKRAVEMCNLAISFTDDTHHTSGLVIIARGGVVSRVLK